MTRRHRPRPSDLLCLTAFAFFALALCLPIFTVGAQPPASEFDLVLVALCVYIDVVSIIRALQSCGLWRLAWLVPGIITLPLWWRVVIILT